MVRHTILAEVFEQLLLLHLVRLEMLLAGGINRSALNYFWSFAEGNLESVWSASPMLPCQTAVHQLVELCFALPEAKAIILKSNLVQE